MATSFSKSAKPLPRRTLKSKLSKVFGTFCGRRLMRRIVWIVVCSYLSRRYSKGVTTLLSVSGENPFAKASCANSAEEKSSFSMPQHWSITRLKLSFIPGHPLGKVELFKSVIGLRLSQLFYLCPDRHRRELLRLGCSILVLANAVTSAPGYLVRRQQESQILRIDVQRPALPGNAGILADVLIRDAKAPPLEVDEAVKANLSGRTEIAADLQRVIQAQKVPRTDMEMRFLRDAVESLEKRMILLVTPLQGLLIQVRYVPEGPTGEEIALYKSDQTFYLVLGVGMAGLAELRLEANRVHKGLVFTVPNGLPIHIPVVYHTFHIVRQNFSCVNELPVISRVLVVCHFT